MGCRRGTRRLSYNACAAARVPWPHSSISLVGVNLFYCKIAVVKYCYVFRCDWIYKPHQRILYAWRVWGSKDKKTVADTLFSIAMFCIQVSSRCSKITAAGLPLNGTSAKALTWICSTVGLSLASNEGALINIGKVASIQYGRRDPSHKIQVISRGGETKCQYLNQ